jgi:hypothetical protein
MSETKTAQNEPNPIEIGIQSLRQLCGKNFWIPGYQRGYRWDRDQVEALLDDILEFHPTDNDSFYCLQPLVVKQDGESWEVVDGQQRLTTLVLILRCLGEQTTPSIAYQTRTESQKFIEAPNEKQANQNIDFYFIYEAHKAIQEWFTEKRGESYDPAVFKEKLLDQVKVIWYPTQLGKSVALFTRINVGKIPLTEAELIRALFLRSNSHCRFEIALEWDLMEKALRADAMWLFLNPQGAPPENRISFIFNLVVAKEQAEKKRGVFLHFYDRHKKAKPNQVTDIWGEVRRVFHQLDAWYQDRTLFHLIGYLIATNACVRELQEIEQQALTKRAFVDELKQIIRRRLQNEKNVEAFISELRYQVGPVKDTLLLFNIASTIQLKESNSRFDFAAFKSQSWDIEHVHSQTPEGLGDQKDKKAWLEHLQQYLPSSHEFAKNIRELIDGAWNNDDFEKLYKSLLREYEEHEVHDELMHSIGNLVLLDSGTNRSYKNAMFPVKRRQILNLEKEGMFVPPTTRNVFLKAYSRAVDNPLKWDSANRDDYQNEICKTLKEFFSN